MGKNAINTKVNINSKNTKITSDGVLIAQGTNDLPDSTNIYMYLFSKFRFILFTSFVFARGRTNLVPSVFAKDSFPSQTFVLESATPCPAEDDTNSSTRKSICWRSLPFAWKLPAQPCVQGTTLTTVSIRLSFIKS